MIVEERMRTFINSLDTGNTPFLEELEQYALQERVPVIQGTLHFLMNWSVLRCLREFRSFVRRCRAL